MALTTCQARTDWVAASHGFAAELCGEPAVESYVTVTGLRVGYCDAIGHENLVRRVWAERVEVDIPEPVWLHERPDLYPPDPIDLAKWEADRHQGGAA